MDWQALTTGRFGASASVLGIDPQLVWADATDFRDYRRHGDDPIGAIPVLVELLSKSTVEELCDELKHRPDCSVTPTYKAPANTRYCTAVFSAQYCKELLRAKLEGNNKLGAMIERFEMQMPVIPQRPRPVSGKRAKLDFREAACPAQSDTEVLLGIIDSGCAFAHERLRRAGGAGTRVLNIWDQDAEPAFTSAGYAGQVPPEFGYGCEASRTLLNRIMADCCDTDNSVNEAACYELAGDDRLRRRFNHGAAVLDLFAGRLPLAQRLPELRQRDDATVLPAWKPRDGVSADALWHDTDDDASKADIVFVQLPRDAVQDSSSAGLPRLILDGLRYIVSCAGRNTKHIVVNLSDGSSRGTHDGHSMIELAMLELVQQQRKAGRTLSIVVAAGNSHDEERHAQFDEIITAKSGKPYALTLRVPPGSETPFSVVVVLPAVASDVRIRLTPPGGKAGSDEFVKGGEAKACLQDGKHAFGIVNPSSPRENRVALISLAPTASFEAGMPTVRGGDWTIELESDSGVNGPIHLYIPRTQTNGGALRRALQAHFIDVDGTYDPERHLRSSEVDPPSPSSPIRRKGTLSSLATMPPGLGVYVIGSYELRGLRPSLHSSDGPSLPRKGTGPQRTGPDALAVADIARSMRGLRATGTFSGDTVRVVGTSFSTPQAARALANKPVRDGPDLLVAPPQANLPSSGVAKGLGQAQLASEVVALAGPLAPLPPTTAAAASAPSGTSRLPASHAHPAPGPS